MRAISIVLAMPLIILSKAGILFFRSESIFLACGQLISLIPGKIGIYIRAAFYRFTLEYFHLANHVMFGTLISKMKTRIGKGCVIGAYATIGLAEIGDGVGIGTKASILSGRHQHNFDDPEKGIFEREGTYSPICIGNDVLVGEQSIVMANIGEKSILGAGSVVVKDIPDFTVAVGNPAKPVKNRRLK